MDKAAAEAAARADRAVAVITGEGVTGVVNFEQRTPKVPLKITGTVQGLTPGKHGISINEYGDLSKGCRSTGNHFNPFKKEHGAPDDKIRHLGDLGNVEVDADGTAHIDITDKLLSLSGKNSILGRAIVIHELPDDLGKGANRSQSKKSGSSGNGVAMGIIGPYILLDEGDALPVDLMGADHLDETRHMETLKRTQHNTVQHCRRPYKSSLTREMAVRPDPGLRAVAFIDNEKVKGKLMFEQFRPNQPVKITGEITGLTHGEHGMHVHEFGDVTSGCSSAGAHFNPHNKNHGGIDSEERHVGDLGNIIANPQGTAKINIEDKVMSLYGAHSIVGRCLVVHADRDDLGVNKMDEKSRTSGNSGSRVGCGVIGLAQPEGW